MKERPFEDYKRIVDALNRLRVLNAAEFFKAAILLLWIDADRQNSLLEEEKRYDYVQKIIDGINEIPEGPEPVNWGNFFCIEFICWLVKYINSVWQIAKLNKFELLILRTGKFSLNELYNYQDELDPTLFAAVSNLEEEKFKRSLYESKAKAKIAILLADNGEIEKAKEELSTSVEIIVPILFKCDMRKAFKNISNAYAIKGNFESANEIASKIESEKYKSIAYANIAKEYSKSGNIDKAGEVFEYAISIVANMKGDIDGLIGISKILVSIGKIDKSIELLKTALKSVNEITRNQGLLWQFDILPEIAEIFASAGDHESARYAIDNFELDREDKEKANSKIIIASVKRGDTKKAQEIFETIIILAGNNVEDYNRSKAILRSGQ